MKIVFKIGSIISMLLFIACSSNLKEETKYNQLVFKEVPLRHAKGFKVYNNEAYTKLVVENPWQQAKNISFQYVLSSDTSKNKNCIKTPVQKVICLSTTHLAYICALNKHQTVVGVTNPKLVSDTVIQTQLKSGFTKDIGNEQALNYETILSLNPDVIFAYGVGAEVQSEYQKFAEWGIPVVIISEYLEESPLAKTEWIKFFSCFYENNDKGNLLFNSIENKYIELAMTVKNIENKPKIMSSLPWKGVWYVPGGQSFMANFINDAGGDYLYKNEKSRESLNLSIEKVMLEGQNSEIWIHTGMANSLQEIEGADERLIQLAAFKNKRVYNNNKRQTNFGGNDFWESGVVNPHLILKDLIQIFHPKILNDTGLYYYQKLN